MKRFALLAVLTYGILCSSINESRKRQIRKCMKDYGAKYLDLTDPQDIDILKYFAQLCINQTACDPKLIDQAIENLLDFELPESPCYEEPVLSPKQQKQAEADADLIFNTNTDSCVRMEARTRHSCIMVGKMSCGLTEELVKNIVPLHYAHTYLAEQEIRGNFSCKNGIPTPNPRLYTDKHFSHRNPLLIGKIDCSQYMNAWPLQTTTPAEEEEAELNLFGSSEQESSDEFRPKAEKDTVKLKNVREGSHRFSKHRV